jgi:hypothetical protein
METTATMGNIIDYTMSDTETDLSTTNANIENDQESCSDADYCKDKPPATRIARHRRKGIPRRAPFF